MYFFEHNYSYLILYVIAMNLVQHLKLAHDSCAHGPRRWHDCPLEILKIFGKLP